MKSDLLSVEKLVKKMQTLLDGVGDEAVFSLIGVVTADGFVMADIRSVVPTDLEDLRFRLAVLLRDAVGCQSNEMIRLTDIATKA